MEGRTYNPLTGAEYRNEYVYVVFSVWLAGEQWQLRSTNTSRSQAWIIIARDNTNTYVLGPPFVYRNPAATPSNLLWGTVYSSPLLLLDTYTEAAPSAVWAAYCFRPDYIRPDRHGRYVAPLPGALRYGSGVFGYRWEYIPSSDGRFVDLLRVIRDPSLDVSEREQFLHPHFDPPESLPAYLEWRDSLDVARKTPSGFVQFELLIHERFVTNGWHIPLRSEATSYLAGTPGKPWVHRVLLTTNVSVYADTFNPVPRPSLPTRVRDYRYRRFENDLLFLRATYVLQPGEPWRGPNDPELLAQAEEYIRNGPRYDAFLRPQMRHYLTWLAYAALVIVPLAAYALRRRLPRGTPPRT
ncbi:hypothetical protein [Limisphaera sp. 4302-co]|uniref:hypothetical protein n=1 Tax=Limisphaera sp. 4302-co TaxID=3400417 RepID=UPI003C1E58A3